MFWGEKDCIQSTHLSTAPWFQKCHWTETQSRNIFLMPQADVFFFNCIWFFLLLFIGRLACYSLLQHTRSFQKVSSHVLWTRETCIEEDTRYKKHCTQDNDASGPFRVGTLGPHTILPVTISCPVIFSWIPSMVQSLFPFKGDFSFGKSQK